MRFMVFAPNYITNSAGVRVMHQLCHNLNEAGYEAYLQQGCGTCKNLNTPQAEYASDMAIVYPEIISGNPFNAPKIVRYILNYPGRLAGDSAYPEGDCKISYLDRFYPGAFVYTLDVIEDFFRDEGILKTHDAFYAGKGRTAQLAPGVVEITRSWPKDRRELAEILKRTDNFYTTDDLTAMSEEARRCGAKTFLVNSDGEAVKHNVDFKPHSRERVHDFVNYVREFFA